MAAVNAELEQAGHKLPDGNELLQSAQKRLRSSVELWNGGNYREAYAESERTLRRNSAGMEEKTCVSIRRGGVSRYIIFLVYPLERAHHR